MIYSLNNETQMYDEPILYCKDDIVNSIIFKDLFIGLKNIFE